MPKALRIVLIALGCLAALAGIYAAFLIWIWTDERTHCSASFEDPEAAVRAAARGGAMGYGTSADEKRHGVSVTFISDDDWDHSQELRSDFLEIVETEGGTLDYSRISAQEARARGKTGCREFRLVS